MNDIVSTVSSTSVIPPTEKTSEFKQEISQGNFFDAFTTIIEDAVTLEISTIVEKEGDSDSYSNKQQRKNKGTPGRRMITTIGLLNGDIANYVGDQFLENEAYKDLRQFHETQVDKGQQIIKDNLQSLQNLFDSLMKVYQKDSNKKPS